ncbi:MAG: METTL5 family protein [Thermoplasmata archaeon]|nr:METTL5 family protein [Thermoplasmata archaeon]MCI4357304.1 METTL5 family protein [Thermoplasmata archaeon]
MRRSELVRILDAVPTFSNPDPALEQLVTPPERAADLLLEALARGDLEGRTVADLGTGTGRLAIGAARLGARRVEAYDVDPGAISVGRAASPDDVDWRVSEIADVRTDADTVVMNPPFGAQKRGADRAFWSVAFAQPRAVYAFALADSRTFIQRLAVARGARVEAQRPVDWTLGPTFRHHRKRAVEVPVDLWVLRAEGPQP